MTNQSLLEKILEVNKQQQSLLEALLSTGDAGVDYSDSKTLTDLITPFGNPDSNSLDLINQFRPFGADPYDAEEIVSVPLLASNNLLWRSNGAWSPNGLITMSQSYSADAPDAHRNHWWGSTEEVFGFIYHSQVFVSNTAPEHVLGRGNAMQGYLENPDTVEIDREIVERDGYYQMVLYAAVQADHPVVESYRYRRIADVSVGCLTDGNYICPIDGTLFGSKSFLRCEHGHYMPHWLVRYFVDEEDQNLIAPYFIRDVVTDSVELSSVVVGDVAAAGVITNG